MNARVSRERRERREREAAERREMTAWIVAKVRQLKAALGRSIAATRRELGITARVWQSWACGQYTPDLATIGTVTERLTAILVREGVI